MRSADASASDGLPRFGGEAQGQRVPNAFPPLAGSDFLMADKGRAIDIVLGGRTGPITVNGNSYSSIMPSLAYLSDDDIANVLTYVRSSWGNAGDAVTPDEVAAKRAAKPTILTATAR